jgi:hypothetical protein
VEERDQKQYPKISASIILPVGMSIAQTLQGVDYTRKNVAVLLEQQK